MNIKGAEGEIKPQTEFLGQYLTTKTTLNKLFKSFTQTPGKTKNGQF